MLIPDAELHDLLIKNHLIDEKPFSEVLMFAKNADMKLVDALVEKDVISDENLGILIADHLKIPFTVLTKLSIPEQVFHVIPEKIARSHKIIPFARDASGIKVAMANPSDTDVIHIIERKTGQKVIPFLATERDIFNSLRIYRTDMQKTLEDLLRNVISPTGDIIPSAVPTEKIVDLIIRYAYQDHASDIHIEPQEQNSLVRFRLDGMLHDVLVFPRGLHDQIITRIKVLSRLRTDEHLAPQDGKMRVELDEENLDIRVSVLPVVDGEKIVLRLLSSRFQLFSLLDLGMTEEDRKRVQNGFAKSYGMVLSTGPTGSGKTTSIYAILKILNIREKNITTIEDPAEYRIKGVNQINVNTKANLTFASGLRSILRQDPNIIFVGEIRDAETAGIAVNAALTGHLVLSTLHTNNAATALPRLTDMNVEPFLVASTVNGIIAPRLIRKICEMCKQSQAVTLESLAQKIPKEYVQKYFGTTPEVHIYKGAGCSICHHSGYQGRIGLFEVLEVTKDIKELITKRIDADMITQQAIKEGMTTMLEDGLKKVSKGLTTIEEVLRVTNVELA
jgi:type IV pilus assembly protein PilB